jgi:precorrin-6B methylase 2
MIVESFIIDSESAADEYLRNLLEKHKYRSMNVVTMRAQKYIKDEHLKNYFINKAKEILKTYGREIE